jgi:molecular chaperone DnaK (HSP70)
MSELIHRNTSIPYTISQVYTTSVDYQSIVNIEIYEGERPLVKDNLLLGEFVLSNIQSAPAHVPKIEVTFTIDNNGILTVSARDKANLSQNSVKIDNANGHWNQNQINEMILKAKKLKIISYLLTLF